MTNTREVLRLSWSLWLPVEPDVLLTGLKDGVSSGHNPHLRPTFPKSRVRFLNYPNSWFLSGAVQYRSHPSSKLCI